MTAKKTSAKKAAPKIKNLPKSDPFEAVGIDLKLGQPGKVVLKTFTLRALIPTMMYGNIGPEITVEATSIQEANDYCMPYIIDLFKKYAEEPRDGRPIKITQEERHVPKKVLGQTGPIGAVSNVPKELNTHNAPATNSVADLPAGINNQQAPASEAFSKANKAVEDVTSIEALNLVEDKIRNSSKLTEDQKTDLYIALLKKRKELK